MVETIKFENEVIAIILRSTYNKDGVTFFTPNDYSQQLAYMKHSKGKKIQPHIHKPISRSVVHTQEVLFIKAGKLRVDFFSTQKEYLESRVLGQGDFILIASGGHGFEALEDLEMIEVKQGPYLGDQDKVRFNSNYEIKLNKSTEVFEL